MLIVRLRFRLQKFKNILNKYSDVDELIKLTNVLYLLNIKPSGWWWPVSDVLNSVKIKKVRKMFETTLLIK